MAGAQTTLELQDKLTGPLMKMMKAIDSTIKAMESMDSATQQLDQKSLANAQRSIQSASAEMERLRSAAGSAGESASKAAKQQDQFNNSVRSAIPDIGKLATGLLSVVGAYKMFSAAKDFMKTILTQGIDFHAFKQASEVAFTTFLGDAKLAKQYMDDMYAFALKTPFAYPDLLESSRNLIAFGISAENTFPIMQAIGDAVAGIGGGNAEMQNMADVFGQIQSQGKLTMMEVNRLSQYGVNAIEMLAEASGTTGDAIRKQISAGSIDAGSAIVNLVEGMNKQFGGLMEGVKGTWTGAMDSLRSATRNAGVALTEELMVAEGPLVTLVQNITDMIKRIPGYIGPAVAMFIPLINMLNGAFEAGRFDTFFATMSASLMVIAWLFSVVAEMAIWVAEIIDTFWPLIITILLLIAAAYIPAIIAGLWTMIGTLYQTAVAWLIGLGPIGWIILAVVALIGVIMAFGVTTEQILGFVGGLFFALGATIWNVIALVWNVIAMFAEFLVNVFIDPTYAVQKLFYDLAKGTIDMMAAMAGSFDTAADVLAKVFVSAANIAIGGINMLIKALNQIPGVDIGEVGEVSAGTTGIISSGLKSMANNLKAPTSSKGVVSIPRMDMKSIPGAYQSGKSAGGNMKLPSLGGGAAMTPGDVPNVDISDMMNGALPNGLGNGAGKTPSGLGGKGKNPTGGKLDSIGKIDDKINIADEDLKLLKELADIRSIQNFKTLQPSFTFTGDMAIREEADLDKLVDKLTDRFTEEANASAEGVYS